MKKLALFIIIFLSLSVFADNKCFLVKEGAKIIAEEGDCNTRYSPQSSFKIALSLMGFDSGIFKDETDPIYPCEDGYDYYINVCKGPHNPRTWMRDSCLWYSRVFTQKLGMSKFQKYIEEFDYGNKNISGDLGKNNGLTHSWVSSSLKISPKEQVAFLEKLLLSKLDVSDYAYKMTKKILFKEELSGGWMLYGKTGNGRQIDNPLLQHGWFVGWIEKNARILTFATHIIDETQHNTFASFRIRDEARNKLWYIINELEK
jgi:beta-lactamase class D